MTRPAKLAVAVALLAAAGEVGLIAGATAGTSTESRALLMAFLAGPLLFLALMAWRRRTHPARSRLILWATSIVAVVGLGVLTYDGFISREPGTLQSNPVMLPLFQWVAALAVWVILMVGESGERRATSQSG